MDDFDQNVQQPEAMPPPYFPHSFIELVHGIGGSKLFLAAACLLTVGEAAALGSASKSSLSAFLALLSALAVVAVWFLYAASKRPALPEKTVAALWMVKAYAIADFVYICLVIVYMFITANQLLKIPVTADDMAGVDPVKGISVFIGAIVGLVIFILLLTSTLRMIKSIRGNIETNSFNRLSGIKMFTVIYGIVFAVAGIENIIAGIHVIYNYLNVVNYNYNQPTSIIDLLPSLGSSLDPLAALFNIAKCVGSVMLLVCLNRLNRQLILPEPFGYQPEFEELYDTEQ